MSGILDQIIRALQGGAPPTHNLPTDLGPLIDQLRRSGFGREVDSWIGTGPNAPVAPEAMERAFGRGGPDGGGMMGGLLGGLLAQALPMIIDAMTPRGRVADEDVPEGGLGRVIEGFRKGGGAQADMGGLEGMLGRTLGGGQR